MKRSISRYALPALLAALHFSIPSAWAVVLKSAQVTAVVNDVRVVEAGKKDRPADVSDTVQGDLGIRTGLQSRAELLFQDKTLTRLGANTLFSFNEGTRELELERGTMLLQVPKNVGGAKIRTAAVTAAITGTTILLEYSPIKWKPSQPPGVSADVAAMAPEQCAIELQQPKRTYSAPDLEELRRKAALAKKAAGHVKVMVLEGTLRLFLNSRLGESTLISAGQMIILSPNALTIPPAVSFDIAQLAKTSLLVNNANWGAGSAQVQMARVAQQIAIQQQQLKGGDLSPTNLVIFGGGTEILTAAQVDQGQTARNAVLFAAVNPPKPVPTVGARSVAPSLPETPTVVDLPGGGGVPVTPPALISLSPTTSGSPYPSQGPATHSHSPANSGEVSVGTYSTSEEIRGVVELNLSSIPSGSTPALQFRVSRLTDVSYPETGPGNFTIDVVAYLGDGAATLSDFGATPIGTVGSFSTGGLQVGDTFSFDIDSLVASALGSSATYLGIRLQASSDPGVGVGVAFDSFIITDGVAMAMFAKDGSNLKSLAASGSANGQTLLLTGKTISLGNNPALVSLVGGDADLNDLSVTARGGDGGLLNVNANGAINVSTPIDASTGRNGQNVSHGGAGGSVNLSTAHGPITVSSTIEVSSNDPVTRRVSSQGGNIRMQTAKVAGAGITISNTAQLLSLLEATAPGPGGSIQLASAGANINVSGKIQADRGTVDVRNTGAAGHVFLNSTAQIAADTVKVGALGTNGQLTIAAGSQISAVNTLKLYGGAGAFGKVAFTGAGTVNLSGSTIQIAAKTVEVSSATRVQNNGPTFVHTDRARFGVGAGNGNFQNPVTQGPLSGAPSFD